MELENIIEEHLKTDLQSIKKCKVKPVDCTTLNLIDKELINEIKDIVASDNDTVFFGKSMRDIKCVIQEENHLRFHEIFVKYIAPKKLHITSVNLPYSPLQDKEYKNLQEIIIAYQGYVDKLSTYFNELQRIDEMCTVMEPQNPSFKDDYRRILLDDRTWLHVEVTADGLATNIHLVGHSDKWYDKLQSGLLIWDHDKDIVDNIMTAFDLAEFPVASQTSEISSTQKPIETQTCGICLCDQLPDSVGVPQPLCQNPACGVYFHRNCLYQWLVACSGSRPPAFGVAIGTCPTCLQPVTCNEKDN